MHGKQIVSIAKEAERDSATIQAGDVDLDHDEVTTDRPEPEPRRSVRER
jgi:hypothetical protein